jgi:hypothetical protein
VHGRRGRQLAPELRDVRCVARQRDRPLALERGARLLGRDGRVAVAVAADPGAEPEEGTDAERGARVRDPQAAGELAVDPWDDVEERPLEHQEPASDLVEWRRARRPALRVETIALTTSASRSSARPRSRAPSRGSSSRSRAAATSARWSSTVRRRASVGWAVRTGMTSSRSRSAWTSAALAPPAASSAQAAAIDPSMGAPVSRARRERIRCCSSAALMSWKKSVKALARSSRSSIPSAAMEAANASRPPGSLPSRSVTAARRVRSTSSSAAGPRSSATMSPSSFPSIRTCSRRSASSAVGMAGEMVARAASGNGMGCEPSRPPP